MFYGIYFMLFIATFMLFYNFIKKAQTRII